MWHRQNVASRRIAAIPGVGVLTATAAVATMGDPAAFRSGREFAAWLGLVPRHTGTGGRVRMLGISKRGDTYLRTLLIHGARSVLANAKAPPEWQLRLAKRRPANVVAVALANKTARTIWAVLAHDRTYESNFTSRGCLRTAGAGTRGTRTFNAERRLQDTGVWGDVGRRIASASGESRRFAPFFASLRPFGRLAARAGFTLVMAGQIRPAIEENEARVGQRGLRKVRHGGDGKQAKSRPVKSCIEHRGG